MPFEYYARFNLPADAALKTSIQLLSASIDDYTQVEIKFQFQIACGRIRKP